jgi:hypothetical protein
VAALPEHPSSSRVQQEAEGLMLDSFARACGLRLESTRLLLADGSSVVIDGVDPDRTVIVEAWAHQGTAQGGQITKIIKDALKLFHVSSQLPSCQRKVLLFADETATLRFRGKSWYAGAIRELGVEIEVVELPDEWRTRISEAQGRQYR